MVVPSLVAAAGSDKGKRFLSGFTDFMTGGMTDLDQKGDSRLQEFQKNQMKRNIRAAQGFGDLMTGGMTDFDQKGDNRMQEFQKNQAKRNIEFGKKAAGAVGKTMMGGIGSLAMNAMNLNKVNGTQRMDTGEVSQGAQELAQKVQQNEKTGIMQKVAGFLQNQNPYQELMRDTSVVDPNTGKRINKDLLDLLNNRPDLRKRMDETGSIFSDI